MTLGEYLAQLHQEYADAVLVSADFQYFRAPKDFAVLVKNQGGVSGQLGHLLFLTSEIIATKMTALGADVHPVKTYGPTRWVFPIALWVRKRECIPSSRVIASVSERLETP